MKLTTLLGRIVNRLGSFPEDVLIDTCTFLCSIEYFHCFWKWHNYDVIATFSGFSLHNVDPCEKSSPASFRGFKNHKVFPRKSAQSKHGFKK